MSTPFNSLDSLQGHFKSTYADKIVELVPDGAKLYNMIGFMSADKRPGDFYNQPKL